MRNIAANLTVMGFLRNDYFVPKFRHKKPRRMLFPARPFKPT